MNEIPDSADMIGKFLRKRERFADEPGTALPYGVVEALDMSSFARFFAHGFVTLGGQHSGVDLVEIRETHGLLPIFWREGIPQVFGSGFVAWPNGASNDPPCIRIQS
jgi:hypothetical protein